MDVSNAELSLKRWWRGPRSQEVGEEGDYLTLHCHHQNDPALRRAAMRVVLMFHQL